MRLLVVGQFRWNSGSSQVIREYVRHAPALGIDVAIATGFGSRDTTIARELPCCDDLTWATHLLVVYEGAPFLSADDLERIDRVIPRRNRAVVDADGHWAPLTSVGSDDNAWPCGQDAWRRALSDISDCILQPRLAEPSPGATFFAYFGMPGPGLRTQDSGLRSRRIADFSYSGGSNPIRVRGDSASVDVQYVGNNWFRYAAVREVFGTARSAFGSEAKLRLCGVGWDGSTLPGLKEATYADPAVLGELGIEVRPPVPFGSVVARMGNAVLSPILMRPVLSALHMLTPRMLETAAAATFPIYRDEDRVIGDFLQDGGALCLGDDPIATFPQIMTHTVRLPQLITESRQRLFRDYSYPAVLRRLSDLLG